MKIDNHNTIVSSTISAPVVNLGIDMAGMNHVMSILSNLYSDAPLAVLREYSTNAADSHIAAGNRLPIQVLSPTALLPQLTVIDQGVGMSQQDIIDTYSRYGSSTKRGDNTQVGAFGIGSKSAFTIASQFTVTGIKDGEKSVVLFSLTDDETPILQVVHTSKAVDSPDSVRVSVPIANVDEMRRTIKKFFYVWRPGTVLVDGEKPESLFTDLDVIALDLKFYIRPPAESLASWERVSTVTVVMGNVPYPANTSEVANVVRFLAKGTSVYVMAPVGAVDIAPSREALKDTSKTTAFLENINDIEFRQAFYALEARDITAYYATLYFKALKARDWSLLKESAGDQHWDAWGLQKITADQAPNLTLRSNESLHPGNIPKYVVVTGCDTERKVKLVQNRKDNWRRTCAPPELAGQSAIVIPSAVVSEAIDWFNYGLGRIKTIPYVDFKAQAATLYKSASTGGTSAPTYRVQEGQQPPVRATPAQIKKLARGKSLVVIYRDQGLSDLDNSYIQVSLEGRQSREVAIQRLSDPHITVVDRNVLVEQAQKRQAASLSVYEKTCVGVQRAATPCLRELASHFGNLTDPRLDRLVKMLTHAMTMDRTVLNLPLEDFYLTKGRAEVGWYNDKWPLVEYLRVAYDEKAKIAKLVEVYLNA